jgi:hypothetical protein
MTGRKDSPNTRKFIICIYFNNITTIISKIGNIASKFITHGREYKCLKLLVGKPEGKSLHRISRRRE